MYYCCCAETVGWVLRALKKCNANLITFLGPKTDGSFCKNTSSKNHQAENNFGLLN